MDKDELISESVRRLFASRDKVPSEEVLEVFCEELDGYDPRDIVKAIKRAIRSGGPFIADVEKIIDFIEEERGRPRTPQEVFQEKKMFLARMAIENGVEIQGLESEIKKLKGENNVRKLTQSDAGQNTSKGE